MKRPIHEYLTLYSWKKIIDKKLEAKINDVFKLTSVPFKTIYTLCIILNYLAHMYTSGPTTGFRVNTVNS